MADQNFRLFQMSKDHLGLSFCSSFDMETGAPRKSFSDIINSDRTVLVDFSAEWCGPCKMMAPILKELKTMAGESVTILKVDIDKNPTVASAYQIQSVPTLIIFKKGNIKWRQSGVVQAKQLKAMVDQAGVS